MHGNIDTTELNEDCMCGHDASKFYEWVKIHMAKHEAGDNLTLLKRFRRCT